MAKILYQPGTAVQIRDWKLEELREEGHTYDRRKRVVKAYYRGEDYPYELEGIKMRFAVNEIKSYRKLERDDDAARKAEGLQFPTDYPAPTTPSGVSYEEVNKIVRDTADTLRREFECQVNSLHDHLVEDARLVARSAIEEDQNSGA